MEQRKLKKKQKLDNNDEEEEKQLFLNPLLAFKDDKKKKKDDESDDESQWSDDDKYDTQDYKDKKNAKEEREKKLLGKRKKELGLQGDMKDVRDFFTNDPIEEVPANDLTKKGEDDLPDGYSSMDSDEIAETRALAKKMLRKKFRTETIDKSYSRYAFDDNEDILPSWFMEDEA